MFLKDYPITMRLITYVSLIVAVASMAWAVATDRMSGISQLKNVAETANAATIDIVQIREDFTQHEIQQAGTISEINTKLGALETNTQKILNHLIND